MKEINLVRLIIFYLTAIAVSNIFRFDVFHFQAIIESLPTWTMIFYSPLQAIGVLLGALIALKWLQKEKKLDVSAFGTSMKWSVAMSIIPVLLLLIIGVDNKQGENTHYFGLVAGLSTFIYCFFEEIGWRGYLEQELKGMAELKRVLIIASLWYLWHLSFLRNPDLIQNILFFGWLVLGSWGLGKIIQLTKSLFAATCVHMAINILLFNGFIKEGLGGLDKIVILGILALTWVPILIIWKREKRLLTNQQNK
ncbi:MAG: abortive infection protein [Bacteroidetes bacterium]|nr:abortive infection protein [Bacteroidota bacterium]